MKSIKIIAIATIVTVLIMVSCACAMTAKAEEDRGEFYPLLTVVVDRDHVGDFWIVNCQDREGRVWSFFDDEGTWTEGDIANLLMWNMGEVEEEDEIIEVYWEGYTEDISSFFQMNGWR